MLLRRRDGRRNQKHCMIRNSLHRLIFGIVDVRTAGRATLAPSACRPTAKR